jgi:cold shock CspA family protein/ribosome-associated translation inhibitor RaiA
MGHSEAIDAIVREKATKLESFSSHITSCRVLVEPASRHRRRGNSYEVRIDLTVPGEEIAVTRKPGQHAGYEDIQVALRDAFDAARRQLEDYVRRRRGAVKAHDATPHAHVSKLFPVEGYGFLETPEGREVYFHRDSVLQEGFERLESGDEVTFVGEEGEKGPQASTVRVVGKQHHV